VTAATATATAAVTQVRIAKTARRSEHTRTCIHSYTFAHTYIQAYTFTHTNTHQATAAAAAALASAAATVAANSAAATATALAAEVVRVSSVRVCACHHHATPSYFCRLFFLGSFVITI